MHMGFVHFTLDSRRPHAPVRDRLLSQLQTRLEPYTLHFSHCSSHEFKLAQHRSASAQQCRELRWQGPLLFLLCALTLHCYCIHTHIKQSMRFALLQVAVC